MMQYIWFGKSDLLVFCICMGCMGFGDLLMGQYCWMLDEIVSWDIICYVLEQGINFYDIVIVYQNGFSEWYVGWVLWEMVKCEEVVLVIKFLL